ncbi:alpha/beta hydrolase [Streptomyces griseoluteus]|uniref:alpha/beta fold hydrolase n=1 Tax=Streptomyces griseoluteus TaxID=29306 RepID=UPI0033E323B9
MVDDPRRRGRARHLAWTAPHLAGATRAAPAGGRRGGADGDGLRPDRAHDPAPPVRAGVCDHATLAPDHGQPRRGLPLPARQVRPPALCPARVPQRRSGRGIPELDHRFLRLLAGRGYDVYAYEQAGGGRSDLLPMGQYSISRSVSDLAAFVDHLGQGKVDILGFSSGGTVLTRALAEPSVAARLHRAVIAEPGPMDGPTARLTGHKGRASARGLAPAVTGPRSTRLPRYAVAFGLMRLGVLTPDTGLIGQVEGDNVFTAADLGSDTASAYCARDAHRIPIEDSRGNFSFSPAASLRVQQTVKDSPSIASRLRRSRTPAMLMIAECSSQVRQWETTVLANDRAIRRTQYMPGVGHHMWNGLGDNNDRAADVISAFLQDMPAPLPNHPTRQEIPAFLRDHE